MKRALRGIAVGTVVAIIVIVTVTMFALYRIWQATSQGYKALTEYAIAAQKPMFKIEGFYLNGSNIVVRVVNLGPTAATVRQAMLYGYNFSNVPSSVLPVPINRYVPVGGYFEIPISQSNASMFIGFNRPLRLLVDTDRGLTFTSMDAPQSKIVVNIYMPREYMDDESNPLSLSLSCSGPLIRAPGRILLDRPGVDYNVTKKENTYTAVIDVYGIGTCTLRLEGGLYVPAIGTNLTEWARLRAEAQSPNPERGTFAYLFYQHIKLEVTVKYAPTVVVGPGTVATVDIKVPDLIFTACDGDKLICPPTDEQQPTAFILDFSWYFTPVYRVVGKVQQDFTVRTYAETVPGDTYRHLAYETMLSFLKNGVVRAVSPQGCMVSPNGADPDNVKNLLIQLSYMYTFNDPDRYYARHTGLPILIYGYNITNCPNFMKTNIILDVAVPLSLPRGKYLIIPVFTYDDRIDVYVPVRFHIYVTRPGSTSKVETTIDEWTNPEVVNELAVPLVVDTPGGDHELHIVVENTQQTVESRADYIVLILSKIVVVRVGGFSAFCTYSVSNPPAFPWVEIDLKTGSVTPYGKIVINPLHRPSDPDDINTVREEAKLMTIYYIKPYTMEVRYSPLRSIGSKLYVGSTSVNDLRGHNIAPGYSINIDVYVPSIVRHIVLMQLLLGRNADEVIGSSYRYSPCPYYSISYVCDSVYISSTYRPSIVSWMSAADTDNVYLHITIRFGEAGRHYIVMGMYFEPYSTYYAPEERKIIEGPKITLNKTATWINPQGSGTSAVVPVDDPDGFNMFEVVFAVDVNAGETLSIAIRNPVQAVPKDSANALDIYTLLAITHIAVVKPPADIDSMTVTPDYSVKLGIVLRNAMLINGTDYASAMLLRVDNGEIVARWSIDRSLLSSPSNLLLGIEGFPDLRYFRSFYTTDRNLHEYSRYYLIVYDLQCTEAGTGTGASASSSSAGVAGSNSWATSSSGGGSSGAIPAGNVTLASRGALVYTDFETYPVSGWTNYGGANFQLVSGHKGYAINFTVTYNPIFGAYWAAYYYGQTMSQYSSLWVAVKARVGSAAGGIVLMDSYRSALYEIMLSYGELSVWRYYNGWYRLRSATFGDYDPNGWYTIVVFYSVSGSTITINAFAYDPDGNLVVSLTAVDSGTHVFIPAYIGVAVFGWQGYYAAFDDFIISSSDPRTILFSNLQSGMTVRIYDNLGNQVYTFMASSGSYGLNVVKDIVLGTGGSGRIEVYDASGRLVATYTGVILGGDSYAIQYQ